MIAGTGSGCGKTSVTCALLAALKRLNKNVVSFKCGPDYIDPLFHRKATEVDSFNLDPYLMGDEGVVESLHYHSTGRDIAVIEGAMGLYDGIGNGGEASCNHVAKTTHTPTVLVVDVTGKSLSVCAEIEGYLNFEKSNIVAVILNRVKPSLYSHYEQMIENRTGVKVVGFLPYLPEAKIETRHLGLVAADEIPDIRHKIFVLGECALKTFDFETIFESMATDDYRLPIGTIRTDHKKTIARIYVAHDEAFCFHYEDNHRILRESGADVRFFSPLHDTRLPDDADGLIFWGGYPELHAASLAGNETLRHDIRRKHERGLPIHAECGGFLYMLKHFADARNDKHPMLGIIDGEAFLTDRLRQFGYVELLSHKDNILCDKGDKIRAHSFHYSAATNEGVDFTATKANGTGSFPCIFATKKLFAGYPHIHFGGQRHLAANFVAACFHFKQAYNNGHRQQSVGD